jgi:hypothetical protein
MMAGDLVDLYVVRSKAAKGGTVVLPAGTDVRRVVQAASKKWWCSFGYNYVLSIFHAKQREVLAYFSIFALILRFLSCYCFRLGHPERKRCCRGCTHRDFFWRQPRKSD